MSNSYFPLLPRWMRSSTQRGLLLLGLAGLLPVAQAQVSFGPPTAYSTGGYSQGIVAADFNGDGRPDLATANSASNSVSVLLQSGITRGTFLTTTDYGSGGSFTPKIAVGDLNADGRPDLAVINQTTATVGVLLSSATIPGTFLPVVTYPAGGSNSRGVAIGDMNGDGRLDLIVGSGATVGILLNSATTPGVFAAVVSYSGGGNLLDDIALGDLNGDGRLDVAAASRVDNTISVLLNSATTPGTLGAASIYTANGATTIRDIALGDLNNDGWLDVVVGNDGNSTISVLLNSATTPDTFPTTVNYNTGSTGTILGVAIGDLNGDGLAEVVGVNSNGNGATANTVSILVNSATTPGTFPTPAVLYGTGGSYATNPVIRDLNADGRPDLAVTNFLSASVSVFLNTLVFTPTLTTTSLASGPVGTSITLTGTNLTAASGVSFNGIPALGFVVNSATSITVTVPAGATTGNVTVTTPSGTSNGLLFTVVTDLVVSTTASILPGTYNSITVNGPGNGTLAGGVG